MGSEQREMLPDIRHSVIIDAPLQKVWELVSTAEGIALWFMPNDIEPVEGHSFHLQSPFGPSPCKVTHVEPPYQLSFQWDTDGWFVSFRLKEMDKQTEFTLIHGGWKPAGEVISKAKEDASVIRERMNQGWMDILEKLKKVAAD